MWNKKSGQGRTARRLAKVNRKISRLSAELETLQFLQDRLEKELEPAGRPADIPKLKWEVTENDR